MTCAPPHRTTIYNIRHNRSSTNPPFAGIRPPFAEKGKTTAILPSNLAPWNRALTWLEIRA